MTRPPSLAFARTCKSCRKIRPISDFEAKNRRRTKSCRACLDLLARGRQPKPVTEKTMLPVILPPEQRLRRRVWPSFVYKDEEAAQEHYKTLREHPKALECPYCLEFFVPRLGSQRYCCRRCRSRAKRLQDKEGTKK